MMVVSLSSMPNSPLMMFHHNFISIIFLNNHQSVQLKAPFVNYFQDDFASLPPLPALRLFLFTI